ESGEHGSSRPHASFSFSGSRQPQLVGPPSRRPSFSSAQTVGSRCENATVKETEAELDELQTLLDTSLARSTAHLRSIVTPGERTLTARELVRVLTGMCVLSVATVTARGEPRISAVDGHFLHGRWVFST